MSVNRQRDPQSPDQDSTQATDGVQSVKAYGGTIIAQDEATSAHFDMPRSAIDTGCVDRVLPLAQIAPTLIDLVTDSEGHSDDID